MPADIHAVRQEENERLLSVFLFLFYFLPNTSAVKGGGGGGRCKMEKKQSKGSFKNNI